VEHQVDKRCKLGNLSSAAGKAAFMLAREVSAREDMMMPRQEMLLLFLFIRRELSRDLNKRYS
jgi:hypothetical protein